MRLPRPSLVDVVIAGAFVMLTFAEAVAAPSVGSPWLHAGVAGLAMSALAWHRIFPITVAAVVMASNIVVNPEGQLSTGLALVLVAYTNGAVSAPPRSHLGLAVVLVPFVGALALDDLEPSDLGAALVFLVGPWSVGVAMRQRALRTSQAEASALLLEQEHDQRVAMATAAERTRMARELHDIVSHSLSVIAIQTQAVRRRLHPDQVGEAQDLAAMETTAREALTEMRRLVGVLRSADETASLTPQPGLGEVGPLCERVRASGLDVRVQVNGDPVELPAGLDLAGYRIVQEGLTNALRHSGARTASVVLTYGEDRLDVAVEDDGHGFVPAPDRPPGIGLIGIRERVAHYGGTVEVTSGPEGTKLEACLPLRDAATRPTAGESRSTRESPA